MRQTYSFLNDSLAVQEIRKHKWLESEKTGREIGFATAAVDWVQQYGEAFKRYRGVHDTTLVHPLAEQRLFRRFRKRLPVRLIVDNAPIECHTDDLNLIGLSCTIPQAIEHNSAAQITIRFQSKGISPLGKKFSFRSRVSRVQARPGQGNESGYNIFVPFSDEVRDFVRANHEILAN